MKLLQAENATLKQALSLRPISPKETISTVTNPPSDDRMQSLENMVRELSATVLQLAKANTAGVTPNTEANVPTYAAAPGAPDGEFVSDKILGKRTTHVPVPTTIPSPASESQEPATPGQQPGKRPCQAATPTSRRLTYYSAETDMDDAENPLEALAGNTGDPESPMKK
jgi:hypothetical protein